MLKYGITKKLSRHTNSVLVEAWDVFKMSAGNITREIFVGKNIPYLSPLNFYTNTQACVASAQVYYGAKDKDINVIFNRKI